MVTYDIAYKDGKESIEHQIEIHINDLLLLTRNSTVAPLSCNGLTIDNEILSGPKVKDSLYNAIDFTKEEVLAGLKYVLDYRIKGNRMPNISYDLCSKLLEILLRLCCEKSASYLFSRKLTDASHEAFLLFCGFLDEVMEFHHSVSLKTVTDLKHCLKLGYRITSNSISEEIKSAAIQCLLYLSSSKFPFHTDWKDLISSADINEVASVLSFHSQQEYTHRRLSYTKSSLLYPPQLLHFDRTVSSLLNMFNTSIEKGLETELVNKFREKYGSHILPSAPQTTLLKMLLHQLLDFMVILLIIASAVSFAIDYPHYQSALVLLAVVILNVTIGVYQEAKACKAVNALLSLSVPMARVSRDGVQMLIPSTDLVPGDIVHLEEGGAVPADLRLLQTTALTIDESILTGETVPVSKDPKPIRTKSRRLPPHECKGNAFMSTVVTHGSAIGIVVRIGSATEVGKISSAIQSVKNTKTLLQKKLAKLGLALVIVAASLCILITVVGIIYGQKLKDMVIIGLSLAVSVIPEGLIVVLTITLSLAVERMKKNKAIVKKMPCVETLGSVTVICSDKTGTLTQGKMQAVNIWIPTEESVSLNDAWIAEKLKTPKSLYGGPYFLPFFVCGLCHNASYKNILQANSARIDVSSQSEEWIGDPTEIALARIAAKANINQNQLFEFTGLSLKRLFDVPFDSERKLMSRVFEIHLDQSTLDTLSIDLLKLFYPNNIKSLYGIIISKGAAESVIPKCTSYKLAKTGEIVTITSDDLAYFAEQHTSMASKGLRVLALAYRPVLEASELSVYNENQNADSVMNLNLGVQTEKNMIFLGFIGLLDPPRQGVQELVKQCQTAGIQVVMITGDHVVTAVSIAKDLCIISAETHSNSKEESDMKNSGSKTGLLPRKSSAVMHGVDLELLDSRSPMVSLDPFPCVFARVTPEQKLLIVSLLQKQGHVVAMTGDGVNDAPALKAADVGVAMSIGGSEITKQSADILLGDDNLATLIEAIKEGRRIFDNISKFLVYLLSCNSAEIWVVGLAVFCGVKSPLSSMNILWANIIADTPPSLSLGLEPPEANILERPPRNPVRPVLSWTLIIIILVQGFVIASLAFFPYLYFYLNGNFHLKNSETDPLREQLFVNLRTESFATLTFLQLILVFLSRSLESSFFVYLFYGNPWMIGAFLFSIFCLVLGIYCPGLDNFLELNYLHYPSWIRILISSIILIFVSELLKFLIRRITDKTKKWTLKIK